jgi:hypothetical protein
MTTINPDVSMTLSEAVREVLVVLTGQALEYDPDMDRFRVVTAHLNRALRSNALENNWSFYETVERIPLIGRENDMTFEIPVTYRFRVVSDDAVRILDTSNDDRPVAWAYFLPRDALHKYRNRSGLWCSVTRNVLTLSRPLASVTGSLDDYVMEIPLMREPIGFELPDDPTVSADPLVLAQALDFDFPDVVIARAAWLYAQADPMMQPRVQTLEDQYKNLMYQLIERDTAFTDTPDQNEILVPVQNDIYGESVYRPWPVANRR